jgi:hypothetical protein
VGLNFRDELLPDRSIAYMGAPFAGSGHRVHVIVIYIFPE